jgi:hypothetical protein
MQTWRFLRSFAESPSASGDFKGKDFPCLDHFLAMAFAQLTWRESLRDIEINLRAQSARLYHMEFRCKTISRNLLSTRPARQSERSASATFGIKRNPSSRP